MELNLLRGAISLTLNVKGAYTNEHSTVGDSAPTTHGKKKLKEEGFDGPIYLLSSAGDTVRYNIDTEELGLSGIFQKPIDHKVLINTLKKQLKVD